MTVTSSPFRVVIPARIGSTRLPRKMLADLCGAPVIAWTVQAALNSQAAEVIVATDSQQIADVVAPSGVQVVMTPADLASGTDRVALAITLREIPNEDLVVSVQGDEPFTESDTIARCANAASSPDVDMATVCRALAVGDRERHDPAHVRVVRNRSGAALYFSRAPIADAEVAITGACPVMSRHIGMYGMRAKRFHDFASLPPSMLELAEKLEQLRALEAGWRMACPLVYPALPICAIDTPADLLDASEIVARHGLTAPSW